MHNLFGIPGHLLTIRWELKLVDKTLSTHRLLVISRPVKELIS